MKAAIRAAYLLGIEARYDWAKPGSAARERGLQLAGEAADKALAGKLKLDGDCWREALEANGVNPRATMRELAALPA